MAVCVFYFGGPMNIGILLEKARLAGGFSSKRKLALAVGVANNQIGYYERGIQIPSDKTMMKLSDLAHEDTGYWLMVAAYLRSDETARAKWASIIDLYVMTKQSDSKAA